MDDSTSPVDTEHSESEQPTPSDTPEHKLPLGKRWGNKAEANIEQWDNQRYDILLLALIEEVGEIAMAVESTTTEYQPPDQTQQLNSHTTVGKELIERMAELGEDTRDYLEAEYPEPAGDSSTTNTEDAILDRPNNTDEIVDEVEDAAPLLWQLYWALETSQNETQ